ncbi:MAG TPA: thioredoxin domain-containing protein [Vicinamibacteria bacterium]|nr:thioredoxin domain-containing protein [Vicinamibacteria bacterium]
MGASAVTRVVTALCLCLAAASVSGLLLLQHHGEPGAVSAVSQVCGGEKSSCEEVARSSWSALGGIPLAALGLAFYLALALALALALLGQAEPREALAAVALVLLGLGLLVDLLLLGVQALAIHAYCALCILTYVLGLCALLLLLPARRGLRLLGGTLGRTEGRLALGGWLLGALLAAAGVLAGEAALGAREAQRQATLLGPLPATTPAPAPSATAPLPAPGAPPPSAAASPAPAGPQDARYWQQRAQQLQATLDDPRKLEAYFSDKAQREYETEPPVAIDLSDVPARGPLAAPVKVVEYSDFLCPFCRSLAVALSQFVPQAGGRVVVYFKNYPLDAPCNPKLKQSTHPGSCQLALGAVCAQRQGKFEAYHDKVFSTDLHDPRRADVVRLAGQAGLDVQALQACLDDPKAREALAAQIAEANRFGVAATPTVYVNGKKLPRLNDFVAVVDKEARRKGFPPLQPQ